MSGDVEFPSVSDILRERLVDELIDHGMCADDAEVVADQTVAFAHERASEFRAAQPTQPPSTGGAS